MFKCPVVLCKKIPPYIINRTRWTCFVVYDHCKTLKCNEERWCALESLKWVLLFVAEGICNFWKRFPSLPGNLFFLLKQRKKLNHILYKNEKQVTHLTFLLQDFDKSHWCCRFGSSFPFQKLRKYKRAKKNKHICVNRFWLKCSWLLSVGRLQHSGIGLLVITWWDLRTIGYNFLPRGNNHNFVIWPTKISRFLW